MLDGFSHGTGVKTFADGEEHSGQYLYGKLNGLCKIKYKNGDMFEGEF